MGVDGALPWLVKVGDVQTAAEFINTKNKKSYLTVEKSLLTDKNTGKESKELEYSFSKKLPCPQCTKLFLWVKKPRK